MVGVLSCVHMLVTSALAQFKQGVVSCSMSLSRPNMVARLGCLADS
jgi:hypothetical protein